MVLWGEKNGYHSVNITNTSTHSTFVGLFILHLYPKIGIGKPDLRITNPESELNKHKTKRAIK